MVQRLATPRWPAYGGLIPPDPHTVMSAHTHRYRITVTPIETDGQQCTGRCTLEFDQRSPYSWMKHFEQAQRQRRLSCNDDASLVVATGLLHTLAAASSKPGSALDNLQPELDQLLLKLEQLQEPV